MVSKISFGTDAEGRQLNIFRITNSKGEYAEILDRGAAVHSVYVYDSAGNLDDVVLGGNTPDSATIQNGEGVTIGRVANSIAGASYVQNGKRVELEKNARGGFMHGNSGNYATKLFNGSIAGEQSVLLTYRDLGEGGFPCGADVRMLFTFDDESRLTLDYDICPDGDTPISPTNHSYFNLSGADAMNMYLQIEGDEIAGMEGGSVVDARYPVAGSRSDFRKMVRIKDIVNLPSAKPSQAGERPKDPARPAFNGYNDYFILREKGFHKAAELWCKENGRRMNVWTDMPTIILFASRYKETMVLKHGRPYPECCAICLEAQYMPNAVNCQSYDLPFFSAGEHFVSRTVYAFSHD